MFNHIPKDEMVAMQQSEQRSRLKLASLRESMVDSLINHYPFDRSRQFFQSFRKRDAFIYSMF